MNNRNRLVRTSRLVCLIVAVACSTALAAVSVTEGKWDGAVRAGEPCIVVENPALRLTVLKRGAWIISIVGKRTNEDFVHCNKDVKGAARNGIYDRVNETGSHFSNVASPTHFASREYAIEQRPDGTLQFTCETATLRIVRTLRLDPRLPKMKIHVAYTNVAKETIGGQIVLISQFNFNNAPLSYNHIVAVPQERKVGRLLFQKDVSGDAAAGWYFMADRDSKKALVMTVARDGRVARSYAYRSACVHCIPFSPGVPLKPAQSMDLWQEYYFLSGKRDLDSFTADRLTMPRAECPRLMAALRQELGTAPVKPGTPRKLVLPEVTDENRIEPSPGGRPLATVAVVNGGIYDHPTKLHRDLWTSVGRTLLAVAEVRDFRPDLLIMRGASANGLDREYDLMKKVAALAGVPVTFAPGRTGDVSNLSGFDKTLGPSRWVRTIKDVAFIVDNQALDQSEWFAEQLKKAAGKRIVVIAPGTRWGRHDRETSVNLAMVWINTTCPSFQRVNRWPVLSTQHLRRGNYAVISIFPDYLEVFLKPLGRSLGPRLYLDRDGKSPALGVPPFVKGAPFLKVAHLADTQLALPSRGKTYDGQPLDQENLKRAVAEINELGVDFAVNAGDLVNVGSDEKQWQLYTTLKKPLAAPLYEVLGNHDWDEVTPEGQVITASYGKYVDDPLVYDFEKKGVLVLAAGTKVTSPDDLRARLAKAERAKCTVLLYHYPLADGRVWTPELVDAVKALKPTLGLCGHTHYLCWNRVHGVNEFVGSGLAWTKMGLIEWNGYFIHLFYADRVVSSFKRLGCDDLFFTVTTPYRKR